MWFSGCVGVFVRGGGVYIESRLMVLGGGERRGISGTVRERGAGGRGGSFSLSSLYLEDGTGRLR